MNSEKQKFDMFILYYVRNVTVTLQLYLFSIKSNPGPCPVPAKSIPAGPG